MKISKSYSDMLPIANSLLEELKPFFERLEICGSLRRKKAEIGDIEYIGISKKVGLYGQTTLFGNGEMQHLPDLLNFISKYEIIKGNKPQSKLTSFVHPSGVQVDLFFASMENWGYIQTLRTGPSDFNQYFLIPKLKLHGYYLDEGKVWDFRGPISVPDEETLFKLIDLEVINPMLRSQLGSIGKYHGLNGEVWEWGQ